MEPSTVIMHPIKMPSLMVPPQHCFFLLTMHREKKASVAVQKISDYQAKEKARMEVCCGVCLGAVLTLLLHVYM